MERLLQVPDLVGDIFTRLDLASQIAFFRSTKQVALAGPVLALTRLRIELTPTSLRDQWLHVLRLTG